MATKKGLGRGFESLIPSQLLDESFDPTHQEDEKVSQLREIPLKQIKADPDQPRRNFEEESLHELAASIRVHGILQPIVVTKQGSSYLIVAGERRFRAAKMAELTSVPAIVRSLDGQHRLEVALIENVQRLDLNPLETATGYLKLHQQFNLSYEQISERIGGKAVSTISNMLRLLQLPAEAKEALVKGDISEGHARQILALKEPDDQAMLLKLICTQGWSVRRAEQYVVALKQSATAKVPELAARNDENTHTKALSERLHVAVRLKPMAKGGQLVIRYMSDEELERITSQLLH
jgi:ParB family chromosome partitioning protein